MKNGIEAAQFTDIAAMVELSRAKRIAYAVHQPLFWRKAENAEALQQQFFESLLQKDDIIALVHRENEHIDGFLIAYLNHAPPVYDIGGLNCTIDDFDVRDEALWQTVGVALLDEVIRHAGERGAVQVVVVCGHHDEPKRRLLNQMGLGIASEWYTKSIKL